MANTVKLQGIYGHKEGTAVKNLKIGDVIMWNFGYTSTVLEMTPTKSGKQINVLLKSSDNGNISNRRMGADRLVVVKERKEEKHPIKKAIDSRKQTHNSIYSDIGIALEKFSTEELAEYYINVLGCESPLRYYLEQQIIASEVNKAKAI